MILRLWRGVTPSEKAEAFYEYIKQTGEPAYLQTPGNRGVMIITRPVDTGSGGDYIEFQLLSLWDSLDAIKRFAGPGYEKAQYPFPRDREFLVRLEEKVEHFEVLSWIR